MKEIYEHPQYEKRVQTQYRSLLTMDKYEMARYAAESYAYWSLCALLAEQRLVEWYMEERKEKRIKNKGDADVHQSDNSN